MYLAIYEGHHNARPDYTPELTLTVDEFLAENGDAMSEEEIRAIRTPFERMVIGGGAMVEFTIFPDPNFDPSHEGCDMGER